MFVEPGIAWVGLSAQARGDVGGTALAAAGGAEAYDDEGVRGRNPERYGSLHHPGDAYAMSIFDRTAAALRTDPTPIGGSVRTLVGCGQSQSAGFLTTYANTLLPGSGVVDALFVHSRGSGAAELDGTPAVRADEAGWQLRDDLEIPVLVFEAETDVGPLLGYARARQDPTPMLRVWEVAGTAHADAHLVGRHFGLCQQVVNDGPQHLVAKAAFDALLRWVAGGEPPPQPGPLVTAADGRIERNADGIALGGVRTPWVDVPTEVLSGDAPPDSDRLCSLFGATTPLPGPGLAQRYGDRAGFLVAFTGSLDAAIAAGFVRPVDRASCLTEAEAVSIGS